MIARRTGCLVLLILGGMGAHADDAAERRFAPVGALAGACWEALFPDGATDRHCYAWTLQGGFLRDRHDVIGSGGIYEGETLYGWDAASGALRYWYFNSLGGVSTGSARASGGDWSFDETYIGADGRLEMDSLFQRPADDVYLVTTTVGDSGRDPVRYVRVGAADAWSPLRSALLYTGKHEGDNDLWLRTASGERQLTDHPDGDNFGRWSPDGSHIAFQSQRDGNYEIYLLDLADDSLRNLTGHAEFDGLPVWSPEGDSIAFFSRREITDEMAGAFPGHIYVMDLAGGDPRRVTGEPLTTTWGPSDWSTDGRGLLLSRMVDGQGDVFVLELDSRKETRLTDQPVSEAGARFSPSGEQIAFHADDGKRSDIVVIDADGGNRRVLTSSPGQHYYPAWSPDGRWITFTTVDRSGSTTIRAVSVASGTEFALVPQVGTHRESSWRPGED